MLWVTEIVNTVMRSQYWRESAIVISYDESGGFYDHVPPPIIDKFGYGPRVPAFIISAYAKNGYISHLQRDHAATLKFIEWNWNLKPLGYRDLIAANLLDAFDFKQAPREPYLIEGTRPGSATENIPGIDLSNPLVIINVVLAAIVTILIGYNIVLRRRLR